MARHGKQLTPGAKKCYNSAIETGIIEQKKKKEITGYNKTTASKKLKRVAERGNI